MKHCDTCGAEISDNHPFVVCPQCLFESALKSGGDSEVAASQGRGLPVALEGSRGLASRQDFFQKYDILEEMGEGGQGDVWKVWDFEFRRHVAMKRMGEKAVHSPPAVYRFLAEAQITSQLEHPGILPIFDVGLDPDGRPFYTTQLLPGTTFADVWRRVRNPDASEWPVNRALELMLRVCDVMAHAHSRGVIHRDLKPVNVLVGAFGDVRVIDWGSAHVLENARRGFEEPLVALNRSPIQTDRGEAIEVEPGSCHVTVNSGLPMTILSTPPELLRGELSLIGPRTDIYSMGVMLYELLAGRPPYSMPDGSLPSPPNLKNLILAGPPTPLRSLNRSIPRDLAAICEKAMAHATAERCETMEALADDLRAVLEVRPVKARHPGLFLTLQKWALRNRSYVLLGSGALVAISVVLSIAHGFRAERDSARQIKAIRSAELAARSGHWREALQAWDAAEAAGYNDAVYLGLQRAEAWTILSEPTKSRGVLNRLAKRSDLGAQRGVVLLRLGEHELFEQAALTRGVQLVREALAQGLTNANMAFANGLLAESTPEALELFRQALRFDPYHHGAHRHSLSLEFLLGHHQDLSNHVAVFKILYPDDPSPGFLTAAELAMQGRLVEAQAQLAGLRNQSNSNVWAQLSLACRAYDSAAKFYDVDALLGEPPPGATRLDRLRTDPLAAGFMLLPGDLSGVARLPGSLRMPQLPCLQKGLLEASDALRSLQMPFLGNPAAAVKTIQSAWRHHPEALVPVLAGMLLEFRPSRAGPKPLPLLQMQAELYQRGADSPSVMPQLGRLARYLAASTEFELARRQPTNSQSIRTNCLANIRRAAASNETSAAEYRAYSHFALELGDNGLARQLVILWQERQPGDRSALCARIEVELAGGAFGPALELIDQLLSGNPNDAWALEQRQMALAGLKKLMNSTGIPGEPNP